MSKPYIEYTEEDFDAYKGKEVKISVGDIGTRKENRTVHGLFCKCKMSGDQVAGIYISNDLLITEILNIEVIK